MNAGFLILGNQLIRNELMTSRWWWTWVCL